MGLLSKLFGSRNDYDRHDSVLDNDDFADYDAYELHDGDDCFYCDDYDPYDDDDD